MVPPSGTIFSFIVDDDPSFAYQGWHLAQSLIKHHGGEFEAIHVHFTPTVKPENKLIFADLGCRVHEIEPFGDGKYCNKIAQLENLKPCEFDRAVLLDTDMIAVADFRDMLATDAIQAKIVDLANPSISVLKEIATAAGMRTWPPQLSTDGRDGVTSLGNCNGGFYAVPRMLFDRLAAEWRHWALWLLDHNEPLRNEGKEAHIDQVSLWLSIHMAGLPFTPAPSNLNYYIHFTGPHFYFASARPIALLHYHTATLGGLGLIEPKTQLTEIERQAVACANAQIRRGLDEALASQSFSSLSEFFRRSGR